MSQHAIGSDRQHLLAIDGAFNLRDVGGYAAARGRVRRGVLLRSGHLCGLTEQGRRQLQVLGIRSVIDLRRPAECAAEPGPYGTGDTPCWYALPLLNDEPGFAGQPPPLVEVYRNILDRAQPEFRTIFEHLARPGSLPAIMHCSAGKDRTGLVVALLLDLLGVSHAAIIADYHASEAGLATAPGFEAYRARAIAAGREPFLAAPPSLMRATLDYVHASYGGAAAYLSAAGLPRSSLMRLRMALLEEETDEHP
jgi:protein-tyrosine phosphatase